MKRIAKLLILAAFAFAADACTKQQVVQEPPDFIAPDESAPVPDRYKPLYRPGLSKEEMEQVRAKLPYESISLHRTPCFGECPVYTVTLYRTGKAEFEAVRYLPTLGKFTGEIDLFTYGRLCYLIEKSHFKEMESSYLANWTDDATCVVTVNEGASRKEVSDYGGVGPIELWTIQQLIDGIRGKIEWKPVP